MKILRHYLNDKVPVHALLPYVDRHVSTITVLRLSTSCVYTPNNTKSFVCNKAEQYAELEGRAN